MRSRPPNPKQPKLNLPNPASYEVGYGKPPAQNKFKPGESGNPRGRPRGAKNRQSRVFENGLKNIILQEAYRKVTVKDGEKNITIPIAQVMVRALAISGAKGDTRSVKLPIDMVQKTEHENEARILDNQSAVVNYKLGWQREFELCKKQGRACPELLLHPDDVSCDEVTGHIHTQGPKKKEDIPVWKELKKRKQDSDHELRIFKRDLQREDDPEIRLMIESDMAHEEKIQRILSWIISN